TQSEVFEHASGVESGVDQNNIETGLYPQVHLNANELPDDGSEEETVLERPPAFSPTIRPGVQKPQRSALRGAEGSLPEDGQMVQMPDGGNLFDFEWDDDVIGKIQCSILVHDGEVAATFLASDINARRLLEAETPRLRVQLESKGLRVTKILVRESEED
ncbi:flagellar hook-length control protein FliK, partial [Myxococcota bacterium]|nr:flagellar hook-length control protein FliK [Myxococcota bacterium]